MYNVHFRIVVSLLPFPVVLCMQNEEINNQLFLLILNWNKLIVHVERELTAHG